MTLAGAAHVQVTNTNERRFRVSKLALDGRISAAAKLIVWCFGGERIVIEQLFGGFGRVC